MLQKLFATGILLSCFSVANSQEIAAVSVPANTTATAEDPKLEEKKSNFSISGFADVYFRYNFNKQLDNYTSFTNSTNSFELGMASVKMQHSIGKVGMVADIGFGKRAEDFSYAADKTLLALKQLYVTYSPWENVTLTAGSWATHVGYELVDAPANRNYSMSYLFSYGPFLHTGIKAETSVGRNGFMLGIANPTDLKSTTLDHKYLIGQYSTSSANEKIKAYFNFQVGKPNDSTKNNQFDVVLTGAATDKFSVGVNGSVASFKNRVDGKFGSSSSWYGTALYLNFDPKPWMGITLRSEYFNDEKQLNVFGYAPQGGNVFANTLSFNFKVDNLIIIPEFRMESASQEIFSKASGAPSKSTANVLLAAIYQF